MDICCLAFSFPALTPDSKAQGPCQPTPSFSNAGMVGMESPNSAKLPFLSSSYRVIFYWYSVVDSQGASTMEWVAPQHEEIDLNCEVSSYANAEL
jgi:hypothetical protein